MSLLSYLLNTIIIMLINSQLLLLLRLSPPIHIYISFIIYTLAAEVEVELVEPVLICWVEVYIEGQVKATFWEE